MVQLNASINSIGFTEGLNFKKTYLVTDFDLARVKINNDVRFNIDGQKIDKTLSADIIDMSFINAGDTYKKYMHYKLGKIGAKEWVMRNVNGVVLPYLTSHYLFYDLCAIIVEMSVYPWDDKKYGKRLDRLINMGILSAVTIYGSARLKPYIYFVL